VSWTVHALTFIRDNLKILSWAVTIAVVFFIAIAITSRVHAYRSDQAVKALYEAQKRGEGSSEQQNALKDIIDHYSGTAAGREAMIVLGNQLYKKGDFAGALEQFEKLAKKNKGNSLLKIAALHSVAATQRAMGHIEDAAKTYLAAADDSRNLNKSQSLYQAARCYEDVKQYGEAEKIYRKIIESSEEGDAKSLSEERLLWLTANGSISG